MNRRLPRGARLHNPGNIRHARGVIWQGQAEGQPDSDFVAFKAPEWGIRAMCRVLITYQDKRRAEDSDVLALFGRLFPDAEIAEGRGRCGGLWFWWTWRWSCHSSSPVGFRLAIHCRSRRL